MFGRLPYPLVVNYGTGDRPCVDDLPVIFFIFHMGLWQWGYPKAAIQMGHKSTEFGSITILKTNPYVSMAKFDKYVPQTNTKTNYPYKLWFSKVRGDSIPIQSP